jgi:hypothetical protein
MTCLAWGELRAMKAAVSRQLSAQSRSRRMQGTIINEGHGAHAEHAVLAETNLTLGRPTFYGRYEFVQKDSEELAFQPSTSPSQPLEGRPFNINALTLGASYRLATLGGPRGPELSVGGQLTGYVIPQSLQEDRYYGVVGYVGPGYGRLPLSASVCVRLNAPWMRPV